MKQSSRWGFHPPRICSLPVELLPAALHQEELERVSRLHEQCPAFFAKPGTGLAKLVRMHRRRPVADPCEGEVFTVRQG